MVDFRSQPLNVGDYQYWVERMGGNTLALRQPLSGDKPDPAQPREHLSRVELPDDVLRVQYDVLASGGVPALG